MEHATELRGFLVVASDEAAQLGTISTIYVDPVQRRISALAYRTRRLGGDEYYVPISEIQNIGRDVVLIASESAARKISNGQQPPGRSLKELQGFWVTTMDGHHLGTLIDLDFADDWRISELSLTDDRKLPVNPDDIKIGDAILVPVDYADRVQESGEAGAGLLRRIFGGDTVEDTKKALRRALGGSVPSQGSRRKKSTRPPSPDSHPPT